MGALKGKGCVTFGSNKYTKVMDISAGFWGKPPDMSGMALCVANAVSFNLSMGRSIYKNKIWSVGNGV